jgi:hypothetical protein
MRILMILAGVIVGLAGAAGFHYLPQPWPGILILLAVAVGLPTIASLAMDAASARGRKGQ